MKDSPPRRNGRPPIDANDRTSIPVSFRLPSRQFDRLYQRAQRARSTPADVIRRALSRPDDDDER
jgi:hypothetical protein